MGMKVRFGSVWQDITGAKVFANGAWRTLVAIKAYAGGAWRDVANFTPSGGGGGGGGSMVVTAAPSTVNKSTVNTTATCSAITATPSGGLVPYSYVWSIVTQEAGPAFTINNLHSATATVTAVGLSGGGESCTIHCVVTDSLGVVATSNTVTVNFILTA